MPTAATGRKGNDYEAADAEVRQQFGDFPNSDDLIRANQSRLDIETRKASLKAVDVAATEALDLSKIKVEKGHTVISASVRGGRVVFVADDGTGRWYKSSLPVGST